MKQNQLFAAFPVLQKLINCKMPVKQAYDIYKFAKLVDENKQFFIDKEKQLIEQYHGEVGEGGKISFQNDEDMAQFKKDYAELNALDIEVAPLVVYFKDIPDIEITPMDIASLEGVIDFQ